MRTGNVCVERPDRERLYAAYSAETHTPAQQHKQRQTKNCALEKKRMQF